MWPLVFVCLWQSVFEWSLCLPVFSAQPDTYIHIRGVYVYPLCVWLLVMHA